MKEYLSRQSIPFREVDVSRDPAAAGEMVRLSGQQGVPVTVIDGQVIVGFDRPHLDQVLERMRRPRLGAAVADAAQMAAQGRTSVSRGAYVGRVTPGTAAAQAGLRAGDVIISLAGREVADALAVEQLVPRLPPGRDVPLTYLRDGQPHQTTIRM